jgi:hypothetical protein
MVATGIHRGAAGNGGLKPHFRFIAKVAIIAPLIAGSVAFAPSLASAARSTDAPYVFAGASPEINARYDAYVPVMRASIATFPDAGQLMPPKARQLAEMWWQGYKDGRLKSLPQIRFDESVFDGATGEVLRASTVIDLALRLSSLSAAKKGDAQTAARDAVESMRVVRLLKYTDSVTVSLSDSAWRRDLNLIAAVAPKLTSAQRAETLEAISAFRPDGKDLDSMLTGMYKLYLQDAAPTRLAVAPAPPLGALRTADSATRADAALEGLVKGADSESAKFSSDPFLGAVRRTALNELNTDAAWVRAASRLSGR